MALEFLDPLARVEKPSNILGGICWSYLVVLVERADRYSVAVQTPNSRVGGVGSPEQVTVAQVYLRPLNWQI